MLVLADRGLDTANLIGAVTTAGGDLLLRLSGTRKPPRVGTLPDGSTIILIAGVRLRLIQAQVSITANGATRTGLYRLATTLRDPYLYPARDVVGLYHERWEIETAYFELKSTMLGGRVLRSHTPPGVEQEVYALLVAYQAARVAIADACLVDTRADPDRACFTLALETARDQVVRARGAVQDTRVDLLGNIGRAVLEALLPPRRRRCGPRAVKRPLSPYAHKSLRVDRTSYGFTVSVILTPASDP